MREKHRKEEKEKERQGRIAMQEEIRRLKKILRGRLGRRSCMVEIFQLNWGTMTWRLIKRSPAKTYLKLLEVVMDNISTVEDRYMIEFTPMYRLGPGEKERKTENIESILRERVEVGDIEGEAKGTDIEGIEKIEHAQDIKYEEIECPRCGGKSIKTWPIVFVIKARSEDKRLRHRCTNCNETFSDEDLRISR